MPQIGTDAVSAAVTLADIGAVVPVKWFVIHNEAGIVCECTLSVLQMDNADDLSLIEWAESAKVGAEFRTGGAQAEVTVERTA
jgi:hypothetical protein